jgi:hypothetical protein
MLVVLAHRYDQEAPELVSRWSADGARLLTCADLSRKGWRHFSDAPAESTAVAGGRVVPVAQISGVLTLLPGIFEEELIDIVPSDRSYVAAEMTAFLLCWLTTLPCPVLNRPTPTCLSGPYWRQERWVSAAAGLGIPVQPLARRAVLAEASVPEEPGTSSVTVSVVGEQCLGEVDEVLLGWSRQLAELAGVELLTVRFSSPGPEALLLDASLRPDFSVRGVEDALLARFSTSSLTTPVLLGGAV